jgi:hypothetical protein
LLKINADQVSVKINGLELEANQLLFIPLHENRALKLLEYRTKPKDTIKTISTTFKIDDREIEYFNSFNKLYLVNGQTLEYDPKKKEPVDEQHQFYI